jgi:hypothetical protein
VRARGRGWLRWRCRRPGLVVQSRGSPQRQGGLGRRDDRVGSPLAPGLAGLALEPAGQPGPAQPLDLMGVGPASQELEGCLGHVRSQGRHPVWAQDFRQGVKALHAGRAPMHQAGSELHGPLERITGPVGGLWVEAIRVQQRQPSQQLRVQPVGLGVLGVLGAESADCSAGTRTTVAPRRRNHAASGTQALRVGSITTSTSVASPGSRAQSASSSSARVRNWWPDHTIVPVWSAQAARCAARHAMSIPKRTCTCCSSRSRVLNGGGHDGGRGAPDIRYQRSPAADPGGGVIRFLTGPCLLAGVGPVRHHGQRPRSRPQPLQSLSQQ